MDSNCFIYVCTLFVIQIHQLLGAKTTCSCVVHGALKSHVHDLYIATPCVWSFIYAGFSTSRKVRNSLYSLKNSEFIIFKVKGHVFNAVGLFISNLTKKWSNNFDVIFRIRFGRKWNKEHLCMIWGARDHRLDFIPFVLVNNVVERKKCINGFWWKPLDMSEIIKGIISVVDLAMP